MRTLILLDVDGVLIHPMGYKTALRDTIAIFASQLGFGTLHLSPDDIAFFEACGLTNEWDSATFCVGALLSTALQAYEQKQAIVHPTNFSDALAILRQAELPPLTTPDFRRLASQVAELNKRHETPTNLCLSVLKSESPDHHHAILQTIFADIYSIDNPITRTQQVHTLGHLNFAQTYHQDALHESESYLVQHDTPLISPESIQKLLAWRDHSSKAFVIYTARPSHPPTGDTHGYAPEADLAVELLGLKSQVPLIATGRMEWIAEQYKRHVSEYVKPSPVQALAAIAAALSNNEILALKAAAALHEEKRVTDPFTRLHEKPTRVVVFDDSIGGLHAVKLATEFLQSFGLPIEFQAIGVAPEESKQNTLKKLTRFVVNDINEGLKNVLG